MGQPGKVESKDFDPALLAEQAPGAVLPPGAAVPRSAFVLA